MTDAPVLRSASGGDGLLDLMSGRSVEVVGVEDGPDGMTKVYLQHRARGLYALIEDKEAAEAVRDAWKGGQRLLIPTPPPQCLLLDGTA